MVQIIKNDITKLSLDCVVNAANNSLLGGGGVDGMIHRAAGPELYNECLSLGGCRTGDAKITKGYKLPSKYIIHTVGPIYYEDDEDECEQLLSNCYENSLNLAKKYDIHSIAFPSISTGAYCYPIEKACKIALKTIQNWQKINENYEISVIICCFDDKTYKNYIEENKK